MIRRIAAGSVTDAEIVGGKAQGLIRLLNAGLTVPDAWVIPAPVSLDARARTEFLHTVLPDWWARVEPGNLWAVRSSAVAEDLADASFAGVYETKLGLATCEEIAAAVVECWDAYNSEHAVTYRSESGVAGAGGGIALVVQRMVRPQAAGVMLTTDPMRPFEARIVIDAAWGLGEAVVSAATDPDHYVLDRDSGTLIEHRLGDKAIEIVYDRGLVSRDVDEQRRAQRCLDDAALTRLWKAAQTASRGIGPARDLEWAVEDGTVYVVQDRPIVGLPCATPDDVWSRKWGDEYQGGYVFPLTWDMCVLRWVDRNSRTFAQLFAPGRDPGVSVRRYNGYTYLSAAYLRNVVDTIPGIGSDMFREWFPASYVDSVATGRPSVRQILTAAGAPVRARAYATPRKNLAAMERHSDRVLRDLAPRLHRDYAGLSWSQLEAEHDQLARLVDHHYELISWGIPYAVALHQAVPRLLRAWSADADGDLYAEIVGGLPETMTSVVNREIWQLHAVARADETFAADVRGELSVDELRAAHPDSPFWPEFDKFLRIRGHRSSERDPALPRWRESPNSILAMIRAQLRPETPPADPAQTEHAARRAREQAVATALRRAGRLRAPILRRAIRLILDFTTYRENQRYLIDIYTDHFRRLAMEQGRRLVERGVLNDDFDVWFLSEAELRAFGSGEPVPADFAAQLEVRRKHWKHYRDRLPAAYLYDDVEVDAPLVDVIEPPGDDGGLPGVGLCSGRSCGTARVVRTLDDLANVQPGDILVARSIDPAWTSVFPIIGGLVTEIGGVLSHGALLAREYGIPTVSSVANATVLLADGVEALVDGAAGSVVVSPS